MEAPGAMGGEGGSEVGGTDVPLLPALPFQLLS